MVDTLNNFTGDIIKDNSLQRLLGNLPGIKEIVYNKLQDPKDETNVLGIIHEIQAKVIVENKEKIKIKNMF